MIIMQKNSYICFKSKALILKWIMVILYWYNAYVLQDSYNRGVWGNQEPSKVRKILSLGYTFYCYHCSLFFFFYTTTKCTCYRNILLSILLAVPFVTLIYVLMNVSYLTVLSVAEMTSVQAVAVVSTYCLSKSILDLPTIYFRLCRTVLTFLIIRNLEHEHWEVLVL